MYLLCGNTINKVTVIFCIIYYFSLDLNKK